MATKHQTVTPIMRTRPNQRRRLRDLLRDNPTVDPFPEGWFVVDFSKNVKVDKLSSKQWLGEEVVYFRHPATNEVVMTGAYCPHFGGHLDAYGKGGCVKGGVITCPYHHMKFDPLKDSRPGAAPSGRPVLKTYPTMEAHGFVLALRQRDPDAPPIAKPDLTFPGVEDESGFVFGTESFGQFHGDSIVPLLANADYEHFRTVHAFPFAVPDRKFAVDPDRQSCSWSIVLREREVHETEGLLPHMGGKMLWFRQRSWRKAVAKRNASAETMVKVNAYGIGAGLSKSEWWQPSLGLHLLSLLYVTPIDAFRYEVFANCGVKTFRSYRPKMLQKVMNQFGTWFHLWANIHFAKYDDLPFYNRGKIRLNSPAYVGKDVFLKGYVDWWKSEFFSPEYKKMIEGYDLDFE